jgi:hypothetical protein
LIADTIDTLLQVNENLGNSDDRPDDGGSKHLETLVNF